jgi:hypothetical protein
VVLAVILGYAINPAHRSAPHPATTPSPHLINGFEEYQRGKHIVTAGSVSTARPTATLTWLATTSDVAFFVHCPHMKREVTVWLEFSIGSDLLMKTSCSGFLTPNSPGGNVSLPELRAGSRVEVTVQQRGRPACRLDCPTPRAGRPAAGLGRPRLGRLGVLLHAGRAWRDRPVGQRHHHPDLHEVGLCVGDRPRHRLHLGRGLSEVSEPASRRSRHADGDADPGRALVGRLGGTTPRGLTSSRRGCPYSGGMAKAGAHAIEVERGSIRLPERTSP